MLEWKPPRFPNGILQRYVLTYQQGESVEGYGLKAVSLERKFPYIESIYLIIIIVVVVVVVVTVVIVVMFLNIFKLTQSDTGNCTAATSAPPQALAAGQTLLECVKITVLAFLSDSLTGLVNHVTACRVL